MSAEGDRYFRSRLVVVTEKATFHVTINPVKSRNSNTPPAYYNLNIGSRKRKCIQLSVPSLSSGETRGKLIWVEKLIPECYLNAKDKKSLSQHAVNLGFTIARDINPRCSIYEFDDMSKIDCMLPNNKKEVVPMKLFHIAFHGETWYEKYFGAKPAKDQELYRRLKLNLYDSAMKPPQFDFINHSLQKELEPLYEVSRTWYDFFTTIDQKYKDKKCAVIYPWIMNALMHIFENNNIFDYPKWYVDLEENQANTRTPLVQFTSYEDIGKHGGTRNNRKQTIPAPPMYHVNIPQIQEMNYSEFMRDSVRQTV